MDECASCTELRAELQKAYEWGAQWQNREANAWGHLREEIVRNTHAEMMIRQVQGERDELWAQLNTETTTE